MTNLNLCKKCKLRKFDFARGILCSKTNDKPILTDDCIHFENDETVKEKKRLDIKPNEERARVLLLLLWVVLSFEFLTLISSVMQYNLLNTVANGGEITIETANANDLREQVISIFYLIAFVLSGIAFIMWFRRAYFNLHQKTNVLSQTEGWAAGSWFVPVVNLYRPYCIMKELYVETKNLLQLDLSKKLLGIWWALWILNGMLGQAIFRFSLKAETLPELITLTAISIISSIIGIVLGLVTIKVVKDYSKVEGLLAAG